MSGATVRTDESDPFGRRELEHLASFQPAPCVSLHLPTRRAGSEVGQGPVRLRNLLSEAKRELIELGWRAGDVDGLLLQAHQLVDDVDYWRHQAGGLAVFISPGELSTFRVPVALDELAVVSTQFHLSPLLPLVAGEEVFWLLAISQNAVRLFRGSRHAVEEVDIGTTPSSMAAALAHEDPEKQLQVRSGGSTTTGQFHGHGGGRENQKAALERYFRAVDRGLAGIVDRSAPLVIAGVAYYGPIYRSVTRHPRIIDAVVAGSPDELSAIELHERAWTTMEPHVRARHAATLDRWAHSLASGLGVEGLPAVTEAADDGRVELLLLERGEHRWAPHDHARPSEVHDERRPGDLDLLGDIAMRVIRTSGEVVVTEVGELPTGAGLAAILRYTHDAPPAAAGG